MECRYVLFSFLAFDYLGLVRALQRMHEESVRAFQPDFGQNVIRHVFRIRRREIPHHIEDQLGLCERRARLRQPLREGNLEFLASRFLPQRKLIVVLRADLVYAGGKALAPGLEGERDFKSALGECVRCSQDESQCRCRAKCQTLHMKPPFVEDEYTAVSLGKINRKFSPLPTGEGSLSIYTNHFSMDWLRDACVDGTPFFTASSMPLMNVSISSSVV